MNEKSTHQINWIDNLRAIACIFVIILHVSAPWLTNTKWNDWGVLSIIHIITRSSVTLFIMISGALLLPKKTTFSNFYSMRFSKILKPFLFWTFVYTLIFLAYSIYQNNTISLLEQLKFISNSFVFGAAYHLWYMYLIMLFYISLLLFNDIDRKLNKTQLRASLLVWILILSAFQFNIKLFSLNYMHLLFGYFGYFFLGHYLNKHVNVLNTWFSIVIVLAGVVFTFYPIYNEVSVAGTYPMDWLSYRSINVMILSIGIFLLFKSLPFENKLFKAISQKSFGIYLIHLLIIIFLNKVWVYSASLPISIYVLLFALLTLTLSYYSILVLEKISWLRKFIY